MTDNQALFQIAQQRTWSLIRLAEKHFDTTINLGEVRFDLTGKTAGMVVFQPGTRPFIRYNVKLLQENQAEFLAQTLPHEVAHLVARTLYGKSIRPHGDEWKLIMDFYGVAATRCHSYATHQHLTRRLRRFSYSCGCRQHELTSIRHNRIQQGQRYHCKRCGEVLRAIS